MDPKKLKEIVDAAIKLAKVSSRNDYIAGPVAAAIVAAALKDVPGSDIIAALMAGYTS